MKLFDFDFAEWNKIDTKKLIEIISLLTMKKTLKELEEEAENIRARMKLVHNSKRTPASGIGIMNLRIQHGIINTVMKRKKDEGYCEAKDIKNNNSCCS